MVLWNKDVEWMKCRCIQLADFGDKTVAMKCGGQILEIRLWPDKVCCGFLCGQSEPHSVCSEPADKLIF